VESKLNGSRSVRLIQIRNPRDLQSTPAPKGGHPVADIFSRPLDEAVYFLKKRYLFGKRQTSRQFSP